MLPTRLASSPTDASEVTSMPVTTVTPPTASSSGLVFLRRERMAGVRLSRG